MIQIEENWDDHFVKLYSWSMKYEHNDLEMLHAILILKCPIEDNH